MRGPRRRKKSAAGRVQVLDRAIALLNCFSVQKPEMGVGQLARVVGISKTAAHRLLSDLQQHGWIQQNTDDRRYRLGFKLVELGNRVIDGLDLAALAQPFLDSLARKTGETAHLAVLDEGMCYYIAKVESQHSIRMSSHVGKRNPAHCTAVGKTLLAHAPDSAVHRVVAKQGLPRFTRYTNTSIRRLKEELSLVRERGYAIDDQEFEENLRCIAAPVRDHTGKVVAAVSMSGPTMRATDQALPKLAEMVMDTARRISKALGAPGDRIDEGPGSDHQPRQHRTGPQASPM